MADDDDASKMGSLALMANGLFIVVCRCVTSRGHKVQLPAHDPPFILMMRSSCSQLALIISNQHPTRHVVRLGTSLYYCPRNISVLPAVGAPSKFHVPTQDVGTGGGPGISPKAREFIADRMEIRRRLEDIELEQKQLRQDLTALLTTARGHPPLKENPMTTVVGLGIVALVVGVVVPTHYADNDPWN